MTLVSTQLPPEIVRPRHGWELKKSDMWSVGVICYILIVGRPPFGGRNQEEVTLFASLNSDSMDHQHTFISVSFSLSCQILKRILAPNKRLRFPHSLSLTDSCKDFITSLLCDDVEKRLSAEDALKHPWIADDAAASENLAIDALKRFHYRSKLIKILVNAVLHELSEEDQELLSNGLLNLNREVDVMNDEQVLEWLLLHCPIDEQEELSIYLKVTRAVMLFHFLASGQFLKELKNFNVVTS